MMAILSVYGRSDPLHMLLLGADKNQCTYQGVNDGKIQDGFVPSPVGVSQVSSKQWCRVACSREGAGLNRDEQ